MTCSRIAIERRQRIVGLILAHLPDPSAIAVLGAGRRGDTVRMAIPICRVARRQCPRTGKGRLPTYDDWKIRALIMVAALKERKSKSSPYRLLRESRPGLMGLPELNGARVEARPWTGTGARIASTGPRSESRASIHDDR